MITLIFVRATNQCNEWLARRQDHLECCVIALIVNKAKCAIVSKCKPLCTHLDAPPLRKTNTNTRGEKIQLVRLVIRCELLSLIAFLLLSGPCRCGVQRWS